MSRAKRVEAAGVVVELAELEQARESVEEELAQTEPLGPAEVDELVRKAAELGWHLGRYTPEVRPNVVVDRSGEKPVVRSPAQDALRDGLETRAQDLMEALRASMRAARREREREWVKMGPTRRG